MVYLTGNSLEVAILWNISNNLPRKTKWRPDREPSNELDIKTYPEYLALHSAHRCTGSCGSADVLRNHPCTEDPNVITSSSVQLRASYDGMQCCMFQARALCLGIEARCLTGRSQCSYDSEGKLAISPHRKTAAFDPHYSWRGSRFPTHLPSGCMIHDCSPGSTPPRLVESSPIFQLLSRLQDTDKPLIPNSYNPSSIRTMRELPDSGTIVCRDFGKIRQFEGLVREQRHKWPLPLASPHLRCLDSGFPWRPVVALIVLHLHVTKYIVLDGL